MDTYNDDLELVSSISFKLDMSELEEYSAGLEDISISGGADEDHLRLTIAKEYIFDVFWLDINTGKLSEYYSRIYEDQNIALGMDEYLNCYLCDLDGNRLSDYYYTYVSSTSFPIFADEDGNYFGLNSQGEVIKEFGKLDYPECENYKDYIVLETGEGEFTVFDEDFKSYGTFKSESSLRVVHWRVQNDEVDVPYVIDGDDIIDPFTGEVIFKDVPYVYSAYMDDGIMAARNGDYLYLSNGKIFEEDCFRLLEADMVLGDLYVFSETGDQLEVYNASKDIEFSIDEEEWTYDTFIQNDKLILYYDGITTAYDISDPDNLEIIFRYQSIEPFAD